MALRNALAKRLSTLKEAGVKTPLVDGLAVLPARILTQEMYGRLEERPAGIPALPTIPSIVSGSAYGEVAGLWYRVAYPKPVKGGHPICTAEGRQGAITSRVISKVADIAITPISKPSDVKSKTITYYSKTLTQYIDEIYAQDFMRGWEMIPFVVWGNIRNAVAQSVGRLLYWVQELVLNPRTDSIRDQLNSAIADENRARSSQADYIVNAVNAKIGEINSKINSQIDRVTAAVNDRLKDLYRMWGIPENMAITPIHIRNVTSTGFEFQSFGKTTIHYIVIGGRA